MTAVEKHIMQVKHIFKQYNILHYTYSIYLCETFALNFVKQRHKSPGIEMLKNVMGSDVVTETRFSTQETTRLKISF